MEHVLLIAAVILIPILSAFLCYIFRNSTVRSIIVVLTAVIMIAVSVSLVSELIKGGGRLVISLEHVPIDLKWIIMLLDFGLLTYIAYIGIKLKKSLITGLSVL